MKKFSVFCWKAMPHLFLSSLALVMFLTLLQYARMGWGLEIQDARLVAAQEPHVPLLIGELIILFLIVIWGIAEFIWEIIQMGDN